MGSLSTKIDGKSMFETIVELSAYKEIPKDTKPGAIVVFTSKYKEVETEFEELIKANKKDWNDVPVIVSGSKEQKKAIVKLLKAADFENVIDNKEGDTDQTSTTDENAKFAAGKLKEISDLSEKKPIVLFCSPLLAQGAVYALTTKYLQGADEKFIFPSFKVKGTAEEFEKKVNDNPKDYPTKEEVEEAKELADQRKWQGAEGTTTKEEVAGAGYKKEGGEDPAKAPEETAAGVKEEEAK